MTCYSTEPKDQILVKGYGFLPFAKNMCENIGKNLSGKYSQVFLIMLTNLFQKEQEKRQKITDDLRLR